MPQSSPRSSAPAEMHELLLELAYSLSGTLDLQEVLSRSLAAARRLVDFRGGSIALVEDGTLRVVVSDPDVSPEVLALRLPVGEGLSGRVASTGRAIYSPDLDTDDRVDPEVRTAGSNRGIVSYFAVPVVASGGIVGVLQVDSTERDAFTEDQMGLLTSLIPLIGSAIQNARVFRAELDSQSRLDEVQGLRSDFIAIATHELRTPLTLLVGFAELLALHAGHIEEDIAVDDLLKRIRGALDRLERRVDELQHLASIDAGSLELRVADVQLAPLLERVAGPMRTLRPIKLGIHDRAARVSADADRLVYALEAVVDNAIKFSPDDSVIRINTGRRGNTINIEVRDEGPGVDSDQVERIFDRFAQAVPPSVRQYGGLGIGLSVARALVEAMGGSVRAENGPPGRFVVSLAAAEESS